MPSGLPNDPAVRAAYTMGRAQAMQDAMRHLFHRHVVERPEATRAVFVAPHPDDIAIGCGGTIQKMLAAGVQVQLVYLTDGRAVVEGEREQAEMADIRAGEARAFATKLGGLTPRMLAWDENTLCDSVLFEERAAQLATVLREFDADAVFVPYLWDQHGHHRVANYLVARAMQASDRYCRVYGFEVWSLAPAGVVVDISAHLEAKKELLGCYASQLALFPYQQMVDVVDRVHAALVGPECSAAEVFCQFDGRAFCRLVESVDLTSAETVGNDVLTIPPDTW